MLDRIVALFALSLAFVVGSLFVAAQYSAAEPPSPSVQADAGNRAGAAACPAPPRTPPRPRRQQTPAPPW